MSRFSFLSLVAAIALATPVAVTTFSTPVHAEGLSPAVGNALKDAYNMANKGNAAGAAAKIQSARGAATTAFEKKKVSEMAAYVFTKTRNYTAAAKELEASGGSAKQIASLYYQAGNYAKATSYAQKLPGDADMQLLVAQSFVKTNQYDKAAAAYTKMINSGRPVRKEWLEGLASAQFKTGKKEAYMGTLERLIKLDPSPSNWRSLLFNLKNERMPESARLALFYLMWETGNLAAGPDYEEFAQLAIVNNAPGVAQQVLQSAVSKSAMSADARTQRLIQAADQRAKLAVANAGKLAASKNPADQITLGKTYLGQSQYPQAIQAFAKAGATPEALLYGGIAHLRSGDGAGAKATLKKIPADSPYSDVGNLWALYSGVKK